MENQYLTPPQTSTELRVALDHILLLIKDKWRYQLTIKNCNRRACFELLTHEKYAKVHAIVRYEKINRKGSKAYFAFDPSTNEWITLPSSGMP